MIDFQSGVIPVGDRLIVYPIPVRTKTEGGILIPEISQRMEALRQIKARIIRKGPRCDLEDVSDGDIVLISKYSGYLFKGKDGRDYRLINDADVTGVIPEDYEVLT